MAVQYHPSLAVAVPTLVGSLLSLLATTIFAILYVLFPPKRHLRQVLICNLLAADWINSLNNSISGLWTIARQKFLVAGPACTANGYIGQLSVQAIDFNILIIAISVLFTVRKNRLMIAQSWLKIGIVCAIPWVVPIITSNIALGLNLYGPVSGNWCWITANHFGLRYALTHGWRIAIFVVTIAIYTVVYVKLRRLYGKRAMLNVNSSSYNSSAPRRHTFIKRLTLYKQDNLGNKGQDSVPDIEVVEGGQMSPMSPIHRDIDKQPLRDHCAALSMQEDDRAISRDAGGAGHDPVAVDAGKDPMDNSLRELKSKISLHRKLSLPDHVQLQLHGSHQHDQHTTSKHPRAVPTRELRHMLLLNGYPILYILLWIPGLANRIHEAFGPSPQWLVIAQASTQFMGVADVLTYAYNEQTHRRIAAAWQEKREGRHLLRG